MRPNGNGTIPTGATATFGFTVMVTNGNYNAPPPAAEPRSADPGHDAIRCADAAWREHCDVGRINGELGDVGRVPVQYLFQSRSRAELVALYRAADVTEDIKCPIMAALRADPGDLTARMRTMRAQVRAYDVDRWAREFLDALGVPPA